METHCPVKRPTIRNANILYYITLKMEAITNLAYKQVLLSADKLNEKAHRWSPYILSLFESYTSNPESMSEVIGRLHERNYFDKQAPPAEE